MRFPIHTRLNLAEAIRHGKVSRKAAVGLLFLLVYVVCFSPTLAAASSETKLTPLNWDERPPLPFSYGVSGMYSGLSNGAIVVAGGTNSSPAQVSRDPNKEYFDTILVLEHEAKQWKTLAQKLPRQMANGVSVSYDNGLICVGGGDGEKFYADVFMLKWEKDRIVKSSLPSLPEPCAQMCGAIVGDVLYIAGGSSSPDAKQANRNFWAMKLSVEPADRKWVALNPWPGPARKWALSASQDGSFFLVGGLRIGADPKKRTSLIESFLQDCYRYTPGEGENWLQGKWTKIADLPRAVFSAPSPAPALGLAHFLILGGMTGTENGAELSEEILAYHTSSDSWVEMGQLPDGFVASASATTQLDGKWLVVGSKSTGTRSSEIFTVGTKSSFGWLNWAVLLLYLTGMLGMGVYLSRREKTTKDFFLAGGRIPWWAAGLSIYGTQLSGITFIALPEETFLRNWTVMIGSLLIVAMAPIIIHFYLPFFRRLNVTSAYEYLEKRFSIAVRLFGSITFMLFQVGRMGIVLFIPAIVLSVVTGIDIYLCIVVMGVFCIIYTALGGIEAVIWTDVAQVIVLMGGALLCLIIIVMEVNGGLGEIISIGLQDDKFRMFNWGWDATKSVFWVMLVGFFFLSLIPYSSDQTVIQRYLTTKDEQAARKSIWVNALLVLPTIPIFFGLGTALYVFCKTSPGIITAEKTTQILPWFIVAKLPAGIAGLVIAGVFAAAMSSLDSAMNSMATVYVTDFHKRFKPSATDEGNLRLARWLTVLFGIIGTSTALILAAADVQSLFKFFQVILGMLGGSLAGLFILGIFTRRTVALGALMGVAAGTMIPLLVKYTTSINSYLYGAIGVIACVLVGYVSSLILGGKRRDLKGLTLYTMPPQRGPHMGTRR